MGEDAIFFVRNIKQMAKLATNLVSKSNSFDHSVLALRQAVITR